MLVGERRSWGSQPAVESGLLPSGWGVLQHWSLEVVVSWTHGKASCGSGHSAHVCITGWQLLPKSQSLVLILTKQFPPSPTEACVCFLSDAGQSKSPGMGWFKTIPPVSSHCWRDRVAGFSAQYLNRLKSRGWLAVLSSELKIPFQAPLQGWIDFSSLLLQDWNSRVPADCQSGTTQILCAIPTPHMAPSSSGEYPSCQIYLLLWISVAWWAQSILRAYLMGLWRAAWLELKPELRTELIRSGSPRIILLIFKSNDLDPITSGKLVFHSIIEKGHVYTVELP